MLSTFSSPDRQMLRRDPNTPFVSIRPIFSAGGISYNLCICSPASSQLRLLFLSQAPALLPHSIKNTFDKLLVELVRKKPANTFNDSRGSGDDFLYHRLRLLFTQAGYLTMPDPVASLCSIYLVIVATATYGHRQFALLQGYLIVPMTDHRPCRQHIIEWCKVITSLWPNRNTEIFSVAICCGHHPENYLRHKKLRFVMLCAV